MKLANSRTLILQTCSMAFQNVDHFQKIKGLVARYVGFTKLLNPALQRSPTFMSISGQFDFILGFGGLTTIPHIVAGSVAKLVTRRVVDGYTPRDALTRSFAGDIDALKSSPVIYVQLSAGVPIAKWMGVTAPPDRVWGFDFVGCPTPACEGMPRFSSNRFDDAKYECLLCRWKSARYKLEALPFIKQWDNAHPTVFFHTFPPAAQEVGFWKTAKSA